MTAAGITANGWIPAIGWALLHSLWQGAALAAVTAVFMVRLRTASARYLAAAIMLLLMVAAPVLTTFYIARETAPAGVTRVAPAATQISLAGVPVRATNRAPQGDNSRTFLWLVEAWIVGVACFSLRMLGGLVLLQRMGRRASQPLSGSVRQFCFEIERRMGLCRVIRYGQCTWIQAPAVIGWFRPVILLPVTALTGLSEPQLRAVIAHELAHIKRHDCFVNAFQVVAETLLFYHPAVWWLNSRIRLERENCCDDSAVAVCNDVVEYARALTLMEQWRAVPALAMAANRSSLSARITRLLGTGRAHSDTRGMGLVIGGLALAAGLVATNVFFGFGHSVRAQVSTPATRAGSVAVQAAPSPKPVTRIAQTTATSSAPNDGSYISRMQAAGVSTSNVDELISMKIQGVTPEYVQDMRAEGVTINADTLVSMRVQGITPEYVRAIKAAGLKPTDDELVSMKIQGVTPEYISGLHAQGLQPDADEVISMKIQGVTPDYISGMHARGLQPTVDEVVSMKIQRVTPEYIQQMKALGLKPTVDQIISLKIQGVTPEYVKALQSAGLKLNADEVISAKIQNISPELVENAHKHGFKDLDLDKLMQLERIGVFDHKADI